MADTETIRTIIGIIGNIVSFFLFLSPIPTFLKIIKQKAVQEFKCDPYVVTVLNCMMWSFYGMPFIKTNSILVLTINAFGVVVELAYVTIYLIYAPGRKRRNILIALFVEVIFMALVVIITFYAFHTNSSRVLFVGILCIIFNIIMYASPLTVMRMVIRTKSVKYMPFYLSLASFLNGLLWVTYALLRFDLNVVIPNGLGALSGLVQLILYAIYSRTTRWNENDDKPNVELSRV